MQGRNYALLQNNLVIALGLDLESYQRFVAWALCEHLVVKLSRDPSFDGVFFDNPDALRQFRSILHRRTGRLWGAEDLEKLFERVKKTTKKHFRSPIPSEEYLKLLWQVPLECAKCGRKPPEVKLHVDHVLPTSKGGSSLRHNLQFLCAEDNLRKGNSLEAGEPWLSCQ